ncbi:hypothetical protein CAPTEDRAFT_158885 [Capitella teleta]|uniref:Fascin n=1 Tax=Capitella teleta TaxID=283909 RepID=R7VE03_CAPTE|nr:hypothetical protein CAPTEDRAFT_158885 [Capitella teleta]|eukprot:ELU16787.1 hypothetical protein CAPTEDRAFT_158885 [Capitella teleta]
MSPNGVNGQSGAETLQWKVGLLNNQGRYLTAEAFGFKINASGNVMRKKQVWVIEHDTKEEDVVYIKSHLGRYLAGDKKGNVTCEHEERDPETKFSIAYNPDGSGKWAIRNKVSTYYFGGSEDMLKVYEKQPTASEWWTIRLGVHPQVNIRSIIRSRYARHHPENERIQFDELTPWGSDALITLEFLDGKYAVKASNNHYLKFDGTLVPSPSQETLYTLEIRSGQYSGMALKDYRGKYLTTVGKDAVMQSRNNSFTKDELFKLEDSHPQVFITAHNGKKVSIKQGIDLTANQDELSDRETFQCEFDKQSEKWRFRTTDNKYWSLESASGIQGVGNAQSNTSLFGIEWHEDGHVNICGSNGRYVTARMNGSLYAVSDAPTDKEKFYLTVINRPILVLKCDYGFIGFKLPNNPRIECNKASYDVITLEHNSGGSYFFKGQNGLYWALDDQQMINADSKDGHPFIIELRGLSRFAIKAPNGNYLKGEQNGIVSAKSSDLLRGTLWEF